MKNKTELPDFTSSRGESVIKQDGINCTLYANKFKTPFRLGKKQNRAVLDADGHQVVIFNKGHEYLAEEYVNLMNNKYGTTEN